MSSLHRLVLPAAVLLLSGCAFLRGTPIVHDPVTYESGVVVQDLFLSSGEHAREGDELWIHYTGWIDAVTGERFDSSLDRGEPFHLLLGETDIPLGLAEGIAGMHVCGRRRIWVPSELGFGEAGIEGVVPPDALLVFDVELLSIGEEPVPEELSLQADGAQDADGDEPAPRVEAELDPESVDESAPESVDGTE